MESELSKGFENTLYINGVLLSLFPPYLATFGTFLGILVSMKVGTIFHVLAFSILFGISINFTIRLTMFALNKKEASK